jgi:4-hydroxy-3-methylbut-2-enyl diphosphate reductase
MELAAASDVMLVIGGSQSSNTQKLYDICCGQCRRTYFVTGPEDLRDLRFQAGDRIGITAGASTPNTIIQEVSQHVRRAEL